MTPEQRITQLEQQIQQLKAAATIPYEVDQAFRTRLTGLINLAVSGKGATSENRSVVEAGAGTYSVMGIPDGFLQIVISGTTYYLPYFT